MADDREGDAEAIEDDRAAEAIEEHDRDAEAIEELDRDAITLPRARGARGTGPLPPRADIARRYAIAAERRRLLTHALHSGAAVDAAAELVSEHAITDRFVKLDASEGLAEGSRPTPLTEAVERLRVQAAECREKAIALNAKLVLLEAERAQHHRGSPELHAVREQLVQSSARLDHAVEEIEAVTSVEDQLSTLR